jgi:hypothetical protein
VITKLITITFALALASAKKNCTFVNHK